MKKYTIGACFTPDMTKVLVIRKSKPAWQKGKYNLPGGHIEEGEYAHECIAREFEEETGLVIPSFDWKHVGKIDAEDYYVEFYTVVYNNDYGKWETKTEEEIEWVSVQALPLNVISNLNWLVPFAANVLTQGNHDKLTFGTFRYEY